MGKSTPSTPDVTLADNDGGLPTGDRAVTALDAHIDLLTWLDTTQSYEVAEAFLALCESMDRRLSFGHGDSAEYLRGIWREEIPAMPTYFVTAEMCRVAAVAAADMEPCPVLLPQDLPSPSGFVYFAAAPRYAEYGEGTTQDKIRVRAISWRAGEVGWREQDDPHNVFAPINRPGLTYSLWTRGNEIADDYRNGTNPLNVNGDAYFRSVRWWPFEVSAWAFGVSYVIIDQAEHRSGAVIPEVEWQRRFLTALFALMNQEIVIVEAGRLNRAGWRRLKREQDRFPEFGDLKIVRLRRGFNPMLELAIDEIGDNVSREGMVEWTHRWPVRGHWRNQPYGPGRTQVRRIWIPPYIKGPTDKPLIVRDTIWSLER